MSINHKRFWLLVIYLLILLPFIGYGASQAMQTKVNSPIDWVSDSFPARYDYDQFCQRFGNSDTVIISWSGCTIDNPDLDRFVKALRNRNPIFWITSSSGFLNASFRDARCIML